MGKVSRCNAQIHINWFLIQQFLIIEGHLADTYVQLLYTPCSPTGSSLGTMLDIILVLLSLQNVCKWTNIHSSLKLKVNMNNAPYISPKIIIILFIFVCMFISYSAVCVGSCMGHYLKMKMLFHIWLTLDDLVIKSRSGLVWFMKETLGLLGFAQ